MKITTPPRAFLLIGFNILFSTFAIAQPRPLPNAHAHNDYEHERPLFDALAQGFTSVEVDVHLVNGELYVSHDAPRQLDARQTLKALYLTPLQERINNNKGSVYSDYSGEFFLMIDIKTEAEATYAVLKKQLTAFRPMLTAYEGAQKKQGACTVFLSGNRPIATVSAERERLVALDGRPEDLGKGYSSNLMPVISQRYAKILPWRGKKKIPEKQKEKLEALTAAAQAEGKKVRLWASPEKPKVWKTLLASGVDLINTDKLEALKRFLEKY